MSALPTVTVATTPAGTAIARVSLGDRLRTFEVAAERLKNRLVAVLISEFGMLQDDAHAWAEQQIASAGARAVELETARKRIAELEAQVAALTTSADPPAAAA